MARHPAALFLIPAILVVGCQRVPPPMPGEHGTIEVRALAGPICPVEQDPPDPNCDPRPVDGARILVQPGDGRDIVVGEATTDADGRTTVKLAPGDYLVVGAEVEGLMGLPDPATVVVRAGEAVTVTLTYDTGIR